MGRRYMGRGALIAGILLGQGILFLAMATGGNFIWFYGELTKPPLCPPVWMFIFSLMILYFFLCVAVYNVAVCRARPADKSAALGSYALLLLLGFLWSVLFFRCGWFWISSLAAAGLVVLSFLCAAASGGMNDQSALLTLPYFIWNVYLLYWNIGIAVLN